MNIEIFQRKREFDSVKGEDQQDHSSFQSFFFNKKTLLMSFKLNKNNNWLKIHSILKNNLENWNFDLGMDSWNKWKIKFTTHFIFVNNLQCDLIDLENEKKIYYTLRLHNKSKNVNWNFAFCKPDPALREEFDHKKRFLIPVRLIPGSCFDVREATLSYVAFVRRFAKHKN